MVEVLEEREIERHSQLRVGLVTRQPRREIHGHLFIADGGFEYRVLSRQHPVHRLLLLLLHPAGQGEIALQLDVVDMTGELVREHDALNLDAVHEDYPAPRIGITSSRRDRLDGQVAPASNLFFGTNPRLLKWVKRHGYLQSGRGSPASVTRANRVQTQAPQYFLAIGRGDGRAPQTP